MSVQISAQFDSGNIELLEAPEEGVPLRLAIRQDAGGEHMQWFHFRVSGARARSLSFQIENAGRASYPDGWEGYRVCVSEDRLDWRRVEDCRYEDGILRFSYTAQRDLVWFAYFAPFSQERHQDRIARCTERAQHELLGRTLQGRDMDLLRFGQGERSLWIIARQHPGESMASWWMEGFLDRLMDRDDPQVRRLLEEATVYCVPMMNPDGAWLGHLRTNAVGANLNREWESPSAERSPEVLCVRDRMDETGVDLCLDVHGDEALPYNFLAGAEGTPRWGARLESLQQAFLEAYEEASPDLQHRYGYPVSAPGEANMTMCTNQISSRFDCLAYTLEMPFKDNADAPDPLRGWSPARCERLGRAAVDALVRVLPRLRD